MERRRGSELHCLQLVGARGFSILDERRGRLAYCSPLGVTQNLEYCSVDTYIIVSHDNQDQDRVGKSQIHLARIRTRSKLQSKSN